MAIDEVVDDFGKPSTLLAFMGNIRNEEQSPPKRKRKNSNILRLDAIVGKCGYLQELVSSLARTFMMSFTYS